MINYYNANGYLLEGDQAEAYKAKKKAEKSAANKQRSADLKHNIDRYQHIEYDTSKDAYKPNPAYTDDFRKKANDSISGKSGSKTLNKASKQLDKIYDKHGDIYNKDLLKKKNADAYIKTTSAVDAMARHARRHPTKESTMMLTVNGVSLF